MEWSKWEKLSEATEVSKGLEEHNKDKIRLRYIKGENIFYLTERESANLYNFLAEKYYFN